MKQILILILTIILSISFVYGQELSLPSNIQSPDVRDLGTYGDVPMSLFNGTANVSIPLYNQNIKGVPLNIGLSYNTSGIKVNLHPGSVGQNWSLIGAGGAIIRSVSGSPDESYSTNASVPTPYRSVGYFFNFNRLNDNTFLNIEGLKSLADEKSSYKDFDYQPDIFSFNFMGMSGKFLLDHEGKWRVASESNITVKLLDKNGQRVHDMNSVSEADLLDMVFEIPKHQNNISEYQKSIAGFLLIDDKGNRYTFGVDDKAIEYSIPFFQQYAASHWVANSWKLTKVEDIHMNVLYSFEYEKKRFIAEFYRTTNLFNYSLIYSGDDCGPFGNFEKCKNSCISNYSLSNENRSFGGDLILPSYLTSITTFNGETIEFINSIANQKAFQEEMFSELYNSIEKTIGSPNAGPAYFIQTPNDYNSIEDDTYPIDFKYNYFNNLSWYKVSNIRVKNILSSTIKDISLNYDGFPNNRRLFLSGIDIKGDETDSEKESYHFKYNISQDQSGALPEYLSKKIDHWGYYNGSEYEIDQNNLKDYYFEREPNPKYLQVGLLNSIIYPTGGWMQFIYEPNRYSRYVGDDRDYLEGESGIGPGVRIKEIKTYDGFKVRSKRYHYVNNFQLNEQNESGILTRKPHYYWDSYLHYDLNNEWKYYVRKFSVNSMVPLSNSFGVEIGYSEVVEELEDGSFTIYKYKNFDQILDVPGIFLNARSAFYDPITDRSMLRGKEYEVSGYDNTKKIKYKTEKEYTHYSNKYVRSTNVTSKSPLQNSENCFSTIVYSGTAYSILTGNNVLSREISTKYDDDGAVTLTTSIDYDYYDYLSSIHDYDINHTFLKSSTITHSDKSEEKNIFFNSSFLTESREDANTLLTKKIATGILLKKTSLINNNTVSYSNIVYDKSNISVDDDDLYPNYSENGPNESLVNTTFIDEYDEYGNVCEFHKEYEQHVSYLWGYNGTNIIAKAIGIDYETLKSKAPNVSDFSSNSDLESKLNSLREDISPDIYLETYTYLPGIGLEKSFDINNISTSYSYDNLGRLIEIKNNDDITLKTVNYNLAPNEGLNYSNLSGLDIGVINETTQTLGAKVTFYNFGIIGGSRIYSYNWVIKAENGNLILEQHQTNSPFFETTYKYRGELEVECYITDLVNNNFIKTEKIITVAETN
ncbi:hypothetical protein [Flammeovirga sp. OC4]|uniref:hypothetical protein n=1 Tax=Flammeovirga sp. OC4 TaxID=1382345 RepID=UPI0005C6DF78|nr:hypothetical protein [Flammeovirga sp. OC4]